MTSVFSQKMLKSKIVLLSGQKKPIMAVGMTGNVIKMRSMYVKKIFVQEQPQLLLSPVRPLQPRPH